MAIFAVIERIWKRLSAKAPERGAPRAEKSCAGKPARRTNVATSPEVAAIITQLHPLTAACLLILSVVSGYLNYLSFADMMAAGMPLWQAKTAAAVLAVSVSAVIMLFWSYMIAFVPLDQGWPKRWALFATMLLGCVLIFLISSWMNTAALVGVRAQERDLALKLSAYQKAFDDAHRGALVAGQLAPFLQAEASRFAGMSRNERELGALTGSRSPGAVTATLDQVCARLTSLMQSISGALKDAEQDAAEARRHLKAMQDLLSGQGVFDKRLSAFADHAVAMDDIMARLTQRSVVPAIRHTAGALGSGLVMPATSAKDGALAEKQAAVMDAIAAGVRDIGGRLASAASEIEGRKPVEVPAFTPLGRADAVIVYAGDFLPGWGVAVSLDVMPLVIVLVLTIVRASGEHGPAAQPRPKRRARRQAAGPAPEPVPEATDEDFEDWLERRPGDSAGRAFGKGSGR